MFIRVKTSVSDGSVRPSDLLALFKQTGPETRTHVRSAEFLDNTVELIREMVYTHSMDKPDLTGTHTHTHTHLSHDFEVVSTCDVCVSELLSAEATETILQVTGCSSETLRPVCKSDCLSKRYRTITGHCNNRCPPNQNISFSESLISPLSMLSLILQRKPSMGGSEHPLRALAVAGVWGPSRGPQGLEPTAHLPQPHTATCKTDWWNHSLAFTSMLLTLNSVCFIGLKC